MPVDTLIGHLTFAMKYEGIELGVLKALFTHVTGDVIIHEILKEPTGQYSRKVWFLYEWLLDQKLDIPDIHTGNYVELVDETLQYSLNANVQNSMRHRIRNNLPGVKDFCPMIRRTTLIDKFITSGLAQQVKKIIDHADPVLLARSCTTLGFQESNSTFATGEIQVKDSKTERWSRILRQAGNLPVSKEELIRLQNSLFHTARFLTPGYRTDESFVGDRDRRYGTILPKHLPAKAHDLDQLMDGLFQTCEVLERDAEFDGVLATTLIAFGFIFIHPLDDGNGRIHQYLMHHVLARKKFFVKEMIFPISSTILARINEYDELLRHHSHERLGLVDWTTGADDQLAITNDTIDLYRYFDATLLAEFLYGCVQETVEKKLPDELAYLDKYDRMKHYLDNHFEMPDRLIANLVMALNHSGGTLTRNVDGVLNKLTEQEVEMIEQKYAEIFI
ncbi:Fic family protein [Dyadobacter sp. CY326]|nr:Fic family protein [Dyadobacter sp. CY326]